MLSPSCLKNAGIYPILTLLDHRRTSLDSPARLSEIRSVGTWDAFFPNIEKAELYSKSVQDTLFSSAGSAEGAWADRGGHFLNGGSRLWEDKPGTDFRIFLCHISHERLYII